MLNFADQNYFDADLIERNVPVSAPSFLCSVVIPCYNYGRFLNDALNSVFSQTLESVEVIVIDDGSTDAQTINYLNELSNDTRLKVIRKINGGLSAARNTGIELAGGKYICCLDADDVLHPSYLENCILKLESDERAGFAFSWVKLFGDEDYIWETRDFSIEEALLENHTCVAAVYRRSDWKLAGGYDPRMAAGYEDWEFWLRLAQLGRSGYVVKSPLFFHRRHGRTMTHDAHEKRANLLATMKAINPRLFQDMAYQKKLIQILKIKQRKKLPSLPVKLSEKPTLLIALPWLQPGGAEIILKDVLKHLSHDFHFVIVTTMDDRHDLLVSFLEVTHDIFHLPSSIDMAEFYEYINYIITSRKVSVILNSGSVALYRALPEIVSGNRQLFVVDLLHNDSELGHINSTIEYNNYINKTIVVSQVIARSLVWRGIEKGKIEVIENGVDTKIFYYDQTETDREKIRIGFVGRASTEKQPLLFVMLVHELKKQFPLDAIMVCDGNLIEQVEKKITELGLERDISLFRSVQREQLRLIYSNIDFLVNVSAIEGMPLTILEALACGCPVAAFAVGNIENIIVSGENGIVVKPNRLDLLTIELTKILADRSKIIDMRLGIQKKFSDGDYSLAKTASLYKKVFQNGVAFNDDLVTKSNQITKLEGDQ